MNGNTSKTIIIKLFCTRINCGQRNKNIQVNRFINDAFITIMYVCVCVRAHACDPLSNNVMAPVNFCCEILVHMYTLISCIK